MARLFRVLIADDNHANRTLLRAYLGRLGFDTVIAEDGHQAVALFAADPPDIVLMDLMMPLIDGFEAIKRIRALPAPHWVPVLIISSMEAEYDIVRGLESGADDYLTKPLSYQVFSAKMRNIARTLEFQRAREEAIQREGVITDAVIDGIVTFDAKGNIVTCNRGAVVMLQTPLSDLMGQPVTQLFDERARQGFEASLNAFLVAGDDHGHFVGRVFDLLAQNREGGRFPVEVVVTELPATERRLFIAVVRDVSARKLAERQLADNAARLQQYHDEAEAEAELAKEIIERHIRREGLQEAGVHQIVIPTQRFSGDIVLAARSPSGALYAMLADATGHGLAAAMSGLSIVNYFYQAVGADASLRDMVCEINCSLCALLPSGRFVSAALVRFEPGQRQAQLWVGGVPDVLQFDSCARLVKRFPSNQLPLGITRIEWNDSMLSQVQWDSDNQLLLCSDGVIEAASASGEEFGIAGIERVIGAAPSANRLALLRSALQQHLGGQGAHDDMSILLLDLIA